MSRTAVEEAFNPSSFRDPSGSLRLHEGRVLRVVRPEAAAELDRILALPVVAGLMAEQRLVATVRLEPAAAAALGAEGAVYEHERIPFVSYPAEWSPAMLADAADFTLGLALELLAHGLMLKDATPANVLFKDSRPVFVDLPSIVPRSAGDFVWLARHQFETCFLLPLIASVEAGLPLRWSLQDPAAGIGHEQVARLLGTRRWLKPSLLTSVTLPAALTGRGVGADRAVREHRSSDDAKARFVLAHGFEQLRRKVRRLAERIRSGSSRWQGYTADRPHYGEPDLERKRAFVTAALGEARPRWVLDVGANTGEFSEIAALGSHVVALDIDEVSAGRIFARARERSSSILPLVLDVARPTPGAGWRNRETLSFLERALGRFDTVLMLAVVHHVRIGAGVPLAAIVDLAADAADDDGGHWIVEFVPMSDPMFARLARGREAIYADWSQEGFERAMSRRFDVLRSQALDNGRVLYFARKIG